MSKPQTINVRAEIKAKFQAVANAKRWSLCVTADEAIRALAEKLSVELPIDTATSPDQPHD